MPTPSASLLVPTGIREAKWLYNLQNSGQKNGPLRAKTKKCSCNANNASFGWCISLSIWLTQQDRKWRKDMLAHSSWGAQSKALGGPQCLEHPLQAGILGMERRGWGGGGVLLAELIEQYHDNIFCLSLSAGQNISNGNSREGRSVLYIYLCPCFFRPWSGVGRLGTPPS
jgi:hypothetical protein